MKNFIILIILLFSEASFSQTEKKFYLDHEEKYAFLLDRDIKVSKKKIESTEIDVFVKKDERGFSYTLLISKILDHDFGEGNLLNDAYKNYFSNTCECSVIEIEQILYNNLKVLRHKIKVVDGTSFFVGYNSSFVSDGVLFHILFLTFEKKFELEEIKYLDLMNTLVINGDTTIDGVRNESN